MKYLSIDLEATGLEEKDRVIEFAAIPFCTEEKKVEEDLAFYCLVKCPDFETLKPELDTWVIKHNRTLIDKAHKEGLPHSEWKGQFETYLSSKKIKQYFDNKKITLFGKSLNAIDLPFLNRDLGFEWVRTYFEHQQLDLSSVVHHLINAKSLPPECVKGSVLSKHLGFGEVDHLALDDARNTALMYFKILETCS